MAEETVMSCAVGGVVLPIVPVAEETPTVVWATDSGLRLTSAFGAGLAGVGLRAEGVAGLTLAEYFQTDDPEFPPLAAHRRALRGEHVCTECRWAGERYHLRIAPLRDGQQQIVGCIGVAQPLRSRRASELLRGSRPREATRDGLQKTIQQRTAELAAADRHLQEEVVERRRAERALLKTNQLVNGILRHMPVMVFMLDRNGFFEESFGAGLARLGCQDHELIGQNALEAFPQWRGWIQKALAGNNVRFQSRGTMDGNPWAFENFVAFDALRGCGAVGFAIDITDYKQAEQRERELQAELAHMARVQTMGEMASGMAHELNQPLAAVVMWAEVAAHKIRLGRQMSEQDMLKALDDIAGQAYRAGEIIRRMKDFIRKTEPHRTSVDPAEIISEVLPLVESDLRLADIPLRCDVDRSLPKILIDRIQIQQVLLNLIRNAIEAMEATPAGQRSLSICAGAGDRVIEISVSDSGRGLPQGEADDLFAAFYSTKLDGLGMGLAISRSIIQAHGGRIWATRNPQVGTSFTFTLPIPNEEQYDET